MEKFIRFWNLVYYCMAYLESKFNLWPNLLGVGQSIVFIELICFNLLCVLLHKHFDSFIGNDVEEVLFIALFIVPVVLVNFLVLSTEKKNHYTTEFDNIPKEKISEYSFLCAAAYLSLIALSLFTLALT